MKLATFLLLEGSFSLTVVVVLIVAFAIIAVVVVYSRRKSRANSRTNVEMKGFGVKAKITDEQTSPAPGKVYGEALTSHEGSIQAINELGGDTTLKQAESRGDIRLSTTDSRIDRAVPDPKAPPQAKPWGR